MSSAKRRRIKGIGALPGRKPGMRATFAKSRATFSVAFCATSAGISISISRLQVAVAAVLMEMFEVLAGIDPESILPYACQDYSRRNGQGTQLRNAPTTFRLQV